MHPIQWPDIIIGVLLAEGMLWLLRSALKFVGRHNRNEKVVQRVNEMRPAPLDNYRAITNKYRDLDPLG